MAYDFLGISNKILQALNEVPFADATEFGAATGFHQHIKDSVNYALADIHNEEDNEWEFQVTEGTQVVTIGTQGYSIAAGAASVDWDSFYIDLVQGSETEFTSITADSGAKTFTIAGGSWLTQGFAVGMKVEFTDLSESANNGTIFTINTLTATVMTVDEAVTTISSGDTNFTVKNAFQSPDARPLDLMSLDTYRKTRKHNDLNNIVSTSYEKPTHVVRLSDNDYLITGKPDRTYLIKYDYFAALTLLSAATDAPTIPVRYEQVIIDRALMYANDFRDNLEQSQLMEKRSTDGVNDMRRNLIPQPLTMRFDH
jgi:hypothetical protein